MNFSPLHFPGVESVEVTVIEEHPDGTRIVHTFSSLEEIPDHLAPSFPISAEKTEEALALPG